MLEGCFWGFDLKIVRVSLCGYTMEKGKRETWWEQEDEELNKETELCRNIFDNIQEWWHENGKSEMPTEEDLEWPDADDFNLTEDSTEVDDGRGDAAINNGKTGKTALLPKK